MGSLTALFIGFALGWLAAALLISSPRLQAGLARGQDALEPGVDPVEESRRLVSTI